MEVKKIMVIGNSCSGKTRLSRFLAKQLNIPLTHVDAVQFLPNLILRDQDETRIRLREIENQSAWIIDGFGPLNLIEERFNKADLIIFIKLQLPLVYWWCFKRQVRGLFFRRKELPENCFESTPKQTIKLIRHIRNVHYGMWPQLDRIFQKKELNKKLIVLSKKSDLSRIYKNGFQMPIVN